MSPAADDGCREAAYLREDVMAAHVHTSGPWLARFIPSSYEWCVSTVAGEPIAWIDRVTPSDVGEANARLIAAAPDLLAVLGRLTDVLGRMPAGQAETAIALDDAYTAAIAAINKAKGQEP